MTDKQRKYIDHMKATGGFKKLGRIGGESKCPQARL